MKFLPIVVTTLCAILTACGRTTEQNGRPASTAPRLMTQYGCPTCHVISGVPGAVGKVGPLLDDLVQRSYLAGSIQNTPSNLASWIQHPQRYRPGTAMPEMGVTKDDAQQIAKFLETRD